MKIAGYTIYVLGGSSFSLDGGAMFGVIPKALWSKAYNEGDNLNRIPMTSRLLLLRNPDRNILIDTGCGSKLPPKFKKIYKMPDTNDDIEFFLMNCGLKMSDITDVILTHLHFDHAGGATKIENGKVVPVFPCARHYVQKQQLDWARNPSEKDKASFMPENWEPLAEAGILELIDGPKELFPGIELLPMQGHTPGMQLVRVYDKDKSLLHCADLMPTAAHLPYAFSMGYDNFPLTVIEEKKALLPRAFKEQWILFFQHDVFTTACTIDQNEKGFILKNKVDM